MIMHKKTLTLIALLTMTCLYNDAVNATVCTEELEKTCRGTKEMCDQKSEKSLLACQKIKNQDKQTQCFVKLNQDKRACYEKCSCEKICTAMCNEENKRFLFICNQKKIKGDTNCLTLSNEKIESCKKECLGK
jgi:hypothetical protein